LVTCGYCGRRSVISPGACSFRRTLKAEKPPLAEGINGGWLVGVVATQSVSLLGSQLAPQLSEHAPKVLVFSLVAWLGGGMLYLWIISLKFYRYPFFTMSASDLAPLTGSTWARRRSRRWRALCSWRPRRLPPCRDKCCRSYSRVFVYVALLAWCLVAAGMIGQLLGRQRSENVKPAASCR
jgi:hypothetical protein